MKHYNATMFHSIKRVSIFSLVAGLAFYLQPAQAVGTLSLSSSAITQLTGETASDQAGYAVSSAGDVNADGYADILIGAPFHNGGAGAAYLVYGKAGGISALNLSASTTVKFSGSASGDGAGGDVAALGDVNKDGFADFAIAAPSNDDGGANAGAVYILYGQSTALADMTLNSTNTVELTGQSASDTAGHAVAGAGDVNGDGYDDLLIGANGNDVTAGNAGAVYLVYGQASALSDGALNNSTMTRYVGEAGSDNLGIAVGGAGDVNGDGFDDILMGAHGNDGGASNAGAAYLVYGRSAALASATVNASQVIKLSGEASNDLTGIDVSGAGDVNADGYSDFVVGSYSNDSNVSNGGAAYLVYGQATALTSQTLSAATTTKLSGEAADDAAGFSVASAGDVNNDGYSDVLVGAYLQEAAAADAGAAYLVYGQSTVIADAILNASTAISFTGDTANDQAGWNVAAAGDVNGDHYSDILIGAILDDTSAADAGTAYLIQPMAATVVLTGDVSTNTECGESYTDAGGTATDPYNSATLTVTTSSITTSATGAQTVTFTTSNNFLGLAGTATRSVTVVDTVAPVITLAGDATTLIAKDDVYSDAGATATDVCSGTITVEATGDDIDTSHRDTYTVTYTATDGSNLTTTETRTVKVRALHLTTNGKYLKVKLGDTLMDRVKVNNRKLASQYRLVKRTSFFNYYTTVAVLTTHGDQAKLTVVRLANDYTFSHKVKKTFAVTQRTPVKLKFKTGKHRIIATVGPTDDQVVAKFKLKSSGHLKAL